MKDLLQSRADNARREAAAMASRMGINARCAECGAEPGKPCTDPRAPGMTGAFTHNARLGIGGRG